jgi:hypothetical protein
MWMQMLFWAMVGPKYLQRFLLLWLLLIGIIFYAFVHETFDGSTQRPLPSHQPVRSAANR